MVAGKGGSLGEKPSVDGQGKEQTANASSFWAAGGILWPWTDEKNQRDGKWETDVIICAAGIYRNNANLSMAKPYRLIYMPLNQRHDHFSTWFEWHIRESPYVNFCKEFSMETSSLFLTQIYFSKCL